MAAAVLTAAAIAVVNKLSGRCMGPGGLQNNGIHLEAWWCNGGINQKFLGDPLYGLL